MSCSKYFLGPVIGNIRLTSITHMEMEEWFLTPLVNDTHYEHSIQSQKEREICKVPEESTTQPEYSFTPQSSQRIPR